MKGFLKNTIFFFLIISTLLIGSYTLLDSEGNTRGDIRYTKTARVANGVENYDGLIIGSSRVFDAGDLNCPSKVFNYGIIQGLPKDYAPFIKHAKKYNSIEKVVIGFDFYGSSKYGIADVTSTWDSSEDYVSKVHDENIFKKLFSMYSIERFKRLVNYYFIKNNPFERSENSEPLKKDKKTFKKAFQAIYEKAYSSYELDEEIFDIYDDVKSSSSDSELIVYVTPVSKPLFTLLQNKGLTKEYESFLKDLVDNFGVVFNMMEVNDLTINPKYFKDENHLENEYLKEVICSIYNENFDSVKGTLLTGENIDSYLANDGYLKNN